MCFRCTIILISFMIPFLSTRSRHCTVWAECSVQAPHAENLHYGTSSKPSVQKFEKCTFRHIHLFQKWSKSVQGKWPKPGYFVTQKLQTFWRWIPANFFCETHCRSSLMFQVSSKSVRFEEVITEKPFNGRPKPMQYRLWVYKRGRIDCNNILTDSRDSPGCLPILVSRSVFTFFQFFVPCGRLGKRVLEQFITYR